MKEEKKQTSVRFSGVADAQLDALAERMGISRTAVLELAIRELAIRWGIAPSLTAGKDTAKK